MEGLKQQKMFDKQQKNVDLTEGRVEESVKVDETSVTVFGVTALGKSAAFVSNACQRSSGSSATSSYDRN